MKLMIAAGGTGGHIFPALSVAMEWRLRHPQDELLWVGTSRSRERELCERHGIALELLDVTGINRTLGLGLVRSLAAFAGAVSRMSKIIRREKPTIVLAFGGYVSAPVVVAALLNRVPYCLHEQNTVPGLVNRLFSRFSRCTFLGFQLALGWKLRGETHVVGTPIRKVAAAYPAEAYPEGLDVRARTILVCGGSQGALSMDRLLVPAIHGWVSDGIQVVWQTGKAGYEEMREAIGEHERLFMFAGIPDLYPYYAIARLVVGRSGASTLSEVAYFGLPCVVIPLPWAAENHQWMNAGLVEAQGWGVRVKQDERCGDEVDKEVRALLADPKRYEQMSRRSLDHAPNGAAAAIIRRMRETVGCAA